jgi:hypothetical protein
MLCTIKLHYRTAVQCHDDHAACACVCVCIQMQQAVPTVVLLVQSVPAIMQQCYSVKWGGLDYPGLETYYVHGKNQVRQQSPCRVCGKLLHCLFQASTAQYNITCKRLPNVISLLLLLLVVVRVAMLLLLQQQVR